MENGGLRSRSPTPLGSFIDQAPPNTGKERAQRLTEFLTPHGVHDKEAAGVSQKGKEAQSMGMCEYKSLECNPEIPAFPGEENLLSPSRTSQSESPVAQGWK